HHNLHSFPTRRSSDLGHTICSTGNTLGKPKIVTFFRKFCLRGSPELLSLKLRCNIDRFRNTRPRLSDQIALRRRFHPAPRFGKSVTARCPRLLIVIATRLRCLEHGLDSRVHARSSRLVRVSKLRAAPNNC